MKKAFVIALVFCFGLATAGIAAAAEEAKPEATPEVKFGMAVGDNIRPVTVSSIDGSKKVDVDKTKKKTIFVMISSVCTACRQEVLDLSGNAEYFDKKDVDVYGVVIDMDPKSAAERIGKVPFPLLADSDYKIGNATNLMSTPSTLIVQDGKILYTKSGYRQGQWKEYLK